ncbi:MAG: DUF3386 family protein [Planctomycetaceae bacterium]
MGIRWWGSVLLFALAFVAQAQAHFVWIAVQSGEGGKQEAHVWLSELAEPDDEKLLEKIVQTKAWSRAANGEAAPLKLEKRVDAGSGGLVSALTDGNSAASATCDYGVIERRGAIFWLQYQAKYLNSADPAFKALARDEALTLDVVPGAVGEKQELTVLYQGKPVEGSEVTVLSPSSDEEKATTDAEGKVVVAGGKSGLYSIRAKWEVQGAGKHGDKEYQKVVYYSTLALRVAGASEPKVGVVDPKALLHEAREARASWEKFPGFVAKVKVQTTAGEQSGKIKVSATGEVELVGMNLADEKQVLTTLRSLIGHRLAEESEDDNVVYGEEAAGHSLGRLMQFKGESEMASSYRVRDGVIREVNRQSKTGRFTISVMEVRRNPEGKYLPGVYSVSFWNPDGSLKSSTFVNETWVRVGHLDLPATLERVSVSGTEHRNLRIEFASHQLAK